MMVCGVVRRAFSTIVVGETLGGGCVGMSMSGGREGLGGVGRCGGRTAPLTSWSSSLFDMIPSSSAVRSDNTESLLLNALRLSLHPSTAK